jgi:P27 family predicted phage terminase small subunit
VGRRGTKPRPTALKVLTGARPCRVNGSEPKPSAGRPDPPGHLAGEALAEWARIVEVLDGLGVLTRADGAALSIYCVAHARWLEARALIDEKGLFVDTSIIKLADGSEIANPKGCIKSNPAVAMAAACEATMGRVLGSFGLTPADRSRVKADPNAGPSKLAKFRVKG